MSQSSDYVDTRPMNKDEFQKTMSILDGRSPEHTPKESQLSGSQGRDPGAFGVPDASSDYVLEKTQAFSF